MSTGKYIPPSLRRAQANKSAAEESREPRRSPVTSRYDNDGYRQRDDYPYYSDDSRRDPYYRNNSGYGYPSERGVHSTQNYFTPHQPTPSNRPSRWDSLVSEPSLSRTNSRRRVATKNRLGFHGNLYPSPLMEKELFDTSEHVTEGINFDKYDNIPVDVSGENVPDQIDSFDRDVIPDSLYQNIIRCQYKRPTPVQKYGLSIGIAGRDLMACAQTGSGKTAGFLFPIIASMLMKGPSKKVLPEGGSYEKYYPTCLILSPTRELTSQIHKEAQRFCYCTGVAPAVVYGGTSLRETLDNLRKGCDILVGTPGRILDLLERDYLGLEGITHLVLDEADRMLDMGFEPQIRTIVEQRGMPKERQTMMFSATFPNEIQRLAGDFLDDYVFIAVGRVGGAASDIEQRVIYVAEEQKEDYLIYELDNLSSTSRVLIFVETKRKADILQRFLSQQNFQVVSIHGDRSQMDREDALNAFKKNAVQILVATDVAARGLDIPDVSYVINFDTPQNIDDYVHRIGRTGRAGNTGVAISFINENNRPIAHDLYMLLEESNQKIPSFLEEMFISRQRSSRSNRNFGGRDIRHGTSRSTKFYNRSSSEGGRSAKSGLAPRRSSGLVKREESEPRDSWN